MPGVWKFVDWPLFDYVLTESTFMPTIRKVLITEFGDESKITIVEGDIPAPRPHLNVSRSYGMRSILIDPAEMVAKMHILELIFIPFLDGLRPKIGPWSVTKTASSVKRAAKAAASPLFNPSSTFLFNAPSASHSFGSGVSVCWAKRYCKWMLRTKRCQ
jgi:hypothetical protein